MTISLVSFLAFPCPVRCPQDLSHWGRLSSLSRLSLPFTAHSSLFVSLLVGSPCEMGDQGDGISVVCFLHDVVSLLSSLTTEKSLTLIGS